MSENRFNDCDTIEDVLAGIRESVGKGWIIDRDIDADALARIRELTAVSGEARERARVEMAQMLNDAANGRMAAGFQIVDDSLNRIIDALGYTSAPEPTVTPQRHKPYHCTVCYTTGHSKDGKCVNGHDVTGTSAPASAPVVEMDATAVRRFIDGAQTLIGGLNSRITMIRDGQEWSLYSDGVDFVLRIGGTDE